MTTNLEKNVDVLLSFLEYKAEYNEPIIEQWENKRGAIARAFYDSLRPWASFLITFPESRTPQVSLILNFRSTYPVTAADSVLGLALSPSKLKTLIGVLLRAYSSCSRLD